MLNNKKKTVVIALVSGALLYCTNGWAIKDWNFMVYMCNNNNLHRYGMNNFRQMTEVGSSPNTNVLLQMDAFGEKEVMRFYIERNTPIVVDIQSNHAASFSGTPSNLFEFAAWGIKKYPAKKICLDLWNHGTGIKDPCVWGKLVMRYRDDLFVRNKNNGLLELNRNYKEQKALIDALSSSKKDRGIAFNDTAQTYLTNTELKNTLDKISQELLNGRKIEVLALDACLMAMIEIASQVKKSVKYITASEEVAPGAGYNYTQILTELTQRSLDERTLACHIVHSYGAHYRDISADYTQSAIDLSYIDTIEEIISKLSKQLSLLITKNNTGNILAIREIRLNKSLTTEFFDSDYIDLGHFLKSLIIKSKEYAQLQPAIFSFFAKEKPTHQELWGQVALLAYEGLAVLNTMIIENRTGKSLPEAIGLAIYFPTNTIHKSYYKTEFAKATHWTEFLEKFIQYNLHKTEVSDKVLADTRTLTTTTHTTEKSCCDDCDKHKDKPKSERPPCPCKKNKQRISHNKVILTQRAFRTKNKLVKACCDDCAKHKQKPKSQRPPCPCAKPKN